MALLLPLTDLMLVNSEMMSILVPNRLRDHVAHIFIILLGRLLDRNLIQSDGIRHCGPHPIALPSFRKRNAFVKSEQCLIVR